jgi:hypothetical protein
MVPVPDELALRVKRILERFKEITKAWNDLHLDEADAPFREEEEDFLQKPTTPHVDEPTVIGRDDDKENIVKLLLSMNGACGENNASVLPIIGMGGVGKTTLVQIVYNDPRITKQFGLMGWVHVSENFDLKSIMSKIIMSFTRKPCQITELNQLEYMLMEQVVGRKFLLVLDDVWSERKDLWDALLSAMSTAHLGVILVTTRNINVSSVIQQCLPTMWAAYLLMNLGSYLSSWPFVTKIKI